MPIGSSRVIVEIRNVVAEARGERDPWETAAGSDIQEATGRQTGDQVAGGQAVHDVTQRDRTGFSDRRQIDRARPAQQEADVTVDRLLCSVAEDDPESRQAAAQGNVVCRR